MKARERHKEARDLLVRFVKDRVGTPFEAPANVTGTGSLPLAKRLKSATRDACTAMTELRKFVPRDPPSPSPPPPRIGEASDAEHVLYYGEALRVAVRSIAALIVPLYDLGDHELWLRLGVPTPVRAVVPPRHPRTSRGQ